MANYDKPAYTWTVISKAFNTDVYVNELEIPSVNDPEWLDIRASTKNAFTSLFGSGGGEVANGYGYGHSG